ncbi:MAG: deoxynucleoside kinase [Caldilineales bacterium]|nr:deoxynucleoside kinase [Caldilineales bacterium]
MAYHEYIAIEGVIGVGKTTLARMLAESTSAEVLLEVFEENPFLSDFYADRSRYAFQTQIFFLISRYHQQHRVIPTALTQGRLVSDYFFDKDRLFAHLNLANDELAMYEKVQAILAEQIPTPDLVVYLRADTEVLMQRIAQRDRPYERNIGRSYIEDLRLAYERYLQAYRKAPVLVIDTNEVDFVRSAPDRDYVIGLIRTALEHGAIQQSLPELRQEAPPSGIRILAGGRRRLGDFQRFHRALDREKGFGADLSFNFVGLTEEIGEVGREIKGILRQAESLHPLVGNREEALERALAGKRSVLAEEMSDVLAYLLKMANYAGIDLEAAYVDKMGRNWRRTWPADGDVQEQQG